MRTAAAREKQRLRRQRRSSTSVIPDLLEWIPQVSPTLVSPLHLAPAAELLQGFREKPFEFVFSVPPRHGKTILILHFIVWALKIDPTLKIAYVSYAAGQAEEMGSDALRIAHAAGLELSRSTLDAWETPQGGKVLWTGINGAITGKGFNIVVVDDPVKNRVEAESALLRDKTWDVFRSDLYSRLQKGGIGALDPSICVIQTRWHDDDLAGRLTKGDEEEGIDPWFAINIPAISNEGTIDEKALWEDWVPLRRLHKIRRTVGPYAWSSLYQGHPMPRGMSVFGDPTFFEAEPRMFRSGMGLDLSYTAKTSSDHSVIVTIKRELPPNPKDRPRYYIVRVRRKQCRAPEFKSEIRQAMAEHPRSPIRIYASGPELGTVDFIRQPPNPIPVQCLPPNGDKFTRAIPFAAGWNGELVLIPSPELVAAEPGKYGWVNDYLDELKVFTGVKDAADDQVDASAAAYDVLAGPPATYESNDEAKFKPQPRRM